MKKLLIILLLLLSVALAKEIAPYRYIQASGAVSDFVKVGDTLIIGTEEGIIDIYDIKSDTLVDQIVLPIIKDIWGDDMRSLIFSVDYFKGKLLFVARVFSGWRELYLYEDKKLTKLLEKSQKLTLQEVKFVDEETAVIGMMSNRLMLYDLKAKKVIYSKQLNQASLSDIVLDKQRHYLYTADESPLISKIDVRRGTVVETFRKANKREIFSIDYNNGMLLSGGKDKRVVLYKTPSSFTMTKGDFFIYTVALNPDATMAAFVKNEEDEISVVTTSDLKERYLLKGHRQTILKMDFFTSDELITADEDDRLRFWRLD